MDLILMGKRDAPRLGLVRAAVGGKFTDQVRLSGTVRNTSGDAG